MLNGDAKLVMQSVIATPAAAILDFLHGLRGTLHVTFEEGSHSAWLYDLLVRRVSELVVCNPRKNALLKAGNKSDSWGCAQAGRVAACRVAVAGLPRAEQHRGGEAFGGAVMPRSPKIPAAPRGG